MTPNPCRRTRHRSDPDTGFTLIELIVAMALFSVLIVIFMAAVVDMTRSTVRVQNASDSADEARRAYDRFDHQLRYASAVNRPVRVGNTWYLEFQTTVTGTATPSCTQWRLDSGADRVQVRSWDDVAVPTVSGWTTVASRVLNDPSTQQPFTVSPADATYTRQRVALFLTVGNGQPQGMQISGTVVARNTSTSTVTNADTNSDGISDTQVCQQAGRP